MGRGGRKEVGEGGGLPPDHWTHHDPDRELWTPSQRAWAQQVPSRAAWDLMYGGRRSSSLDVDELQPPWEPMEYSGEWKKIIYTGENSKDTFRGKPGDPHITYSKTRPSTWLRYRQTEDGDARWHLYALISAEEGRELLHRDNWTKASESAAYSYEYGDTKETYIRDDGARIIFDSNGAIWDGPLTDIEARRVARGEPPLKYEKMIFSPMLDSNDLFRMLGERERIKKCQCDDHEICEDCDHINQLKAEAERRRADERAGVKRVVSNPQESPARSPSGNIRNAARMGKDKLSALIREMQGYAPDGRQWLDVDGDAWNKIRQAAASKGIPCP